MAELTKKILQEDEYVSFDWKTNNGRAEFVLCPIFKYGKLRKLCIYPMSQPNAKHFYEIENKEGWGGIDFSGLLINDKLEDPHIWTTHFCKEHKTHSLSFYVPKKSKAFCITTGLGNCCINWK